MFCWKPDRQSILEGFFTQSAKFVNIEIILRAETYWVLWINNPVKMGGTIKFTDSLTIHCENLEQ